MYLALTYDHRLLDGREAVTFLVKIKVSPLSLSLSRSRRIPSSGCEEGEYVCSWCTDAVPFVGIHRGSG